MIKAHKLKEGGKPVEAVLMNQVSSCNCELISSAMRPTISGGQKGIHRNDCFLFPSYSARKRHGINTHGDTAAFVQAVFNWVFPIKFAEK